MAEEHQGCSNQFHEDCCVICKLGFKDEKAITVFIIIELGTYLTECIL